MHFTGDDLSRTFLVPSYGPYAEALFCLGVLKDRRNAGALYGGWRQAVVAGHRDAQLIGRFIGNPLDLDLFTLIGKVGSVPEGNASLLAVKRRHLEAEVEAAARHAATFRAGSAATLPRWAFRLPADREVRSVFAAGMRACCDKAVAPFWSRISSYLQAEAALRGRVLARDGVGRFLDTLHSDVRWRAGVLCVQDGAGHLVDVKLHGRGIAVVPSVFCRRVTPYISAVDPDGPAVLFYPALRDVADAYRLWTDGQHQPTSKALAALLGSTRARALDAIGTGCTTTELADRLGISLATASSHASVLRAAGLIATRRHGSAVLHSISPLGSALLNGVQRGHGTPACDRRR